MSEPGFGACSHPERGGNHEWYLTRDDKFGRHCVCRACGKLAPGLSVDPMCAVCKGPVELDRRQCDVCASCDDSEPQGAPEETPCDYAGNPLPKSDDIA